MVFATPLPYCRIQGVRTVKIMYFFGLLVAIYGEEKAMAEREGFEPLMRGRALKKKGGSFEVIL